MQQCDPELQLQAKERGAGSGARPPIQTKPKKDSWFAWTDQTRRQTRETWNVGYKAGRLHPRTTSSSLAIDTSAKDYGHKLASTSAPLPAFPPPPIIKPLWMKPLLPPNTTGHAKTCVVDLDR